MELQDELRAKGLEKVCSDYKLDHKFHQDYPNLVLLKYDMLESNFDLVPVKQARGIIFDRDDNWKVISYTYSKFFNHGEGRAAEIDWFTAKVLEKLDGSLVQLYYYDNKWHCATSGTPDASGQVNGCSFTFKELFWKVWNELGYQLPVLPGVTLAFELMTPFNRVVVPHKKNRIVLHGMRLIHQEPYQEIFNEYLARQHGWEIVQSWPLQNWEQILQVTNTLDPMQQEGFVVCDANFNRVKVKSPQYVAIAHMKDGMGTRRMLELIRINENDEFLAYWPEWRDLYNVISATYQRHLEALEVLYDQIKDIPIQKDFALLAVKSKFSGGLFAMRAKKVTSFKQYFKDMNIKNLQEGLGLKDVNLSINY